MSFRDAGESLEDFADEFLVECPRCAKLCTVRIKSPNTGDTSKRGNMFLPRKATCLACGFAKEWAGDTVAMSEGQDWYFGFPLWLRIPCCGEELWALNERHLAFLEGYVQATQREQTPNVNRSLISRLPTWIKSSKNRSDVLKGLAQLRSKLDS